MVALYLPSLRSTPNNGAARSAHAARALPTYLVHGLRVRSAIVLDAPAACASACDPEIRWGTRRPIPEAVPDGQLLARVDWPDGGFSLTSDPGGYEEIYL